MEASATTQNINAPTVTVTNATDAKPKHNHKPNFGRYVAECAACVARYPDGPPKKSKKDKTAAPPAAPSGDALSQLVQLMLAKEAKTIQKEQDDDARREEARQDMLRIAKEQEAQKLARQANCRHVKENGRSAINGQVHNDGLYHPICHHCFKEFTPVPPTGEKLQRGIQVA